MQVEGVDFISVPTCDAARAVAWYRDVLWLPTSEYSTLEVETQNVTLSFWLPEEQGNDSCRTRTGSRCVSQMSPRQLRKSVPPAARSSGSRTAGYVRWGMSRIPTGTL